MKYQFDCFTLGLSINRYLIGFLSLNQWCKRSILEMQGEVIAIYKQRDGIRNKLIMEAKDFVIIDAIIIFSQAMPSYFIPEVTCLEEPRPLFNCQLYCIS